jgi:hypothetical protein
MLAKACFVVKKVESCWLNSQRMARVPFDKLRDPGPETPTGPGPEVRSLSLSKG